MSRKTLQIKVLIKNIKLLLGIIYKTARLRLFLMGILSIISFVEPLISYYFIKNMTDTLINKGALSELLHMFFFYLSATILFLILRLPYKNIYVGYNNECIKKYVTELLYKKSIKIDLQDYENPNFYDKYQRSMSEAENRIFEFLDMLDTLINSILSLIAISFVLITKEIALIIIVLIAVVVPMLLNLKMNQIIYDMIMAKVRSERFISYIKRVFFNMEYAKELRRTKVSSMLLRKHEEASDNVKKVILTYQTKSTILFILSTSIGIGFGMLAPFIYMAIQVYKGVYTVGEFSALVAMATQLTGSLDKVVRVIPDMYKQSLFFQDFYDVLNVPSVIEESSTVKEISDSEAHSIEFRNVSFRYNNQIEPVLRNISFRIKAGERVALIGVNGSGKSTIVKLIQRLYDVHDGQVLIDGIDVKEVSADWLRKSIATVFQDFQSYAMTIGENILLNEMADDERSRIEDVLKQVELYDYVKDYPMGVDSQLTKEFDEMGLVLSGGMLQKLAIARVVHSKAGIVILDEPSSALDPLTEERILKILDTNLRGRTQIIISHRLSNVKTKDKIIVVDDGIILECGKHEELMEMQGKYYELFTMQADKYL